MNYGKQLSVMAGQIRACFTADKWLWARILLFLIFGLSVVLWCFLGVVFVGFLQSIFTSIGGELDHFVTDEHRSPLVRSTMLIVAFPISLIRYTVAPFFSIVIYLYNFMFNIFAFVVSLGKSGWHASLQYGEFEEPSPSGKKTADEG